MGMLKSIGIEKGKPFDPKPEQKKVLEEAVVAGEAMAKANTFDKRIAEPFWPGRHWKLAMHLDPSQHVENYDQLDERAAWFYEAVTASDDTTGRHPGAGSTYREAQELDSDRPWQGLVHVSAPLRPPAGLLRQDVGAAGYRCRGGLGVVVDNPIDRYSVGSNSTHIKYAADGSLTIYVQRVSPGPERESNWLPTPPGPFSIITRLYGPKPEVLNGVWKQPDIRIVD